MKARIILVRNKVTLNPYTWLFYLIRLFTKSKFNHSAVLIEYDDDNAEVFESKFGGVTSTNYEEWKLVEREKIKIVQPILHQDTEIYVERCKGYLKEKYQFSVYFNYIFYLVGVKFRFGEKGLYCHEFCALVFKENYEKENIIYTAEHLYKNEYN